LALLNSTASADSEERKLNRDRYSRREIFINFISLSIANLFEGNRERLVNEIENVKNKALKTPLQGIVASLEGMKIRNDREVIASTAFQNY
jgi:polynucleotide 5'-kinase involved in rRNA processing